MLCKLLELNPHLIVMIIMFIGFLVLSWWSSLIITIVMLYKLLQELNPHLIVMIIMFIGFLVFSWWSSLIITIVILCKLLQELNPSHLCHDHHVH